MFKRIGELREAGPKGWFVLGLAGLIFVIIVSMVLGVVTNGPSTSNVPAAQRTFGDTGNRGYAATTAATAVTSAAAATTAASREVAPAAPAQQDKAASNGSTGNSTGSSTNQPLPADRLIIRNATISLTANDVEKTLGELRALAVEKNGVVFQSSTSIKEDKTYANITIQVPSTSYDDTLNRLRKLNGVKVESENATSQDVTEEYVDLTAQVNNLKASETQLAALLAKATNVGEVLTVQKELGNVRGEIERRQGRINYFEKKAALSSIAITIAPVYAPAPPPAQAEPGFDAAKVFETAWAGSLKGLQGLFKVAVTLGVWAIWLVPLGGLIALIIVLGARRFSPRNQPPSKSGSEGAAV